MRDQQTQGAWPQEEKEAPQSSEGEAQQPQQPLPDLTKGIPSTLDAELSQAKQSQQPHARKSSLNITEEPDQQTPPDEGGQGGSDAPREQYVSSSDRKKNAVFRYMYLLLGLGAVGYSVYLGRNWESEEEEKKHADAPSGWGLGRFWNRVQARLGIPFVKSGRGC